MECIYSLTVTKNTLLSDHTRRFFFRDLKLQNHFWHATGLLLFQLPPLSLHPFNRYQIKWLFRPSTSMICCRSRIKLRNGMHLFTDSHKKDIIKHHFPYRVLAMHETTLLLLSYSSSRATKILKSSQNKKGQTIFQVHSSRCLFLQLAAEKKTPKPVYLDFFFPSYFEAALVVLV